MHTTNPTQETKLPGERHGKENEGGSSDSLGQVTAERALADGVAEPFPAIEVGALVLQPLELVRVIDKPTWGQYRVQQEGLGENGHVFVANLYGATCAKVELLMKRRLGWPDYLAAIKHAIEREIGDWESRGAPLPRGEQRAVEVAVRDIDFALT
jgi:hypothetical protein